MIPALGHSSTSPDRGGSDPAIRAARSADTTVTVTADGQPLANQQVVVSQRDHAFLFGSIGFEFVPPADDASGPPDATGADDATGARRPAGPPSERYAHLWLDLFNLATLPFYWGQFEPVRGRPRTGPLLDTARWFAERGCRVKGHPLAWHTETADWLLGLSTEEVARAQVDRIHRELADFGDLIDVWDVINEVVIMPVFDQYDNGITRLCRKIGRIPMIRTVFDAAREAAPHATLLLNDFDMSTGYECLIEGVLEAGIRIDALGLQSHMHQGYWGEEKTGSVLDRFSRYGLPLHFTETTLVSGDLMPEDIVDLNDYQVPEWPSTPQGEARQADEIGRHYRTLLAHPAVEAITYWGMSDRGAWLGAPGGLVRGDDSPKPAYDTLHALIKGEWWLEPTTMTTDDRGRLRFRGFLGGYDVRAAGRGATFRLDRPGTADLTVALDPRAG